ncbi:LIC13305 family lipoprotein [Leptospira alstonii]|uniref:LIC13305 family lipoprotein n=1 Tax=Leptospira alstonii TaxID=28452 RepID=UPI000772EC61|nr:putative zinc-binding metallopeptidase [Leptospira alstonii]
MKVKFVLIFLFLSTLISCNEKKDKIDSTLLYLLLAQPDRAENYDRDVQIITHTIILPSYIAYDLSYSEDDVNHLKEILQVQIAKYPRGYWIKAKVERIILGANLTLPDGRAVSGFADSVSNNFYLTVWPGISNGTRDNQLMRTIHHELAHNFDSAMHRSPNRSDWSSLNTVDYNHNVDWSSPTLLQLTNPVPGFVTLYATSNVGEDYAEIGCGIMGPSVNFAQLINICRSDSIVGAKVNLMISDMKKFWPFPGAESTEWKRRITEISCN